MNKTHRIANPKRYRVSDEIDEAMKLLREKGESWDKFFERIISYYKNN